MSRSADRPPRTTPDVVVQFAHLRGGSAWTEGANETPAAYAGMMSSKHPASKNVWIDMAEAAMIAAELGEQRDEQAWEQFRAIVPLTAEEFAIIENNVAPYMK